VLRDELERDSSPHPIVAIGVLVKPGAVVLGADQRAGVARQADNGEGSEDGVDSTALEAELAQVRASEESAGTL
jgi:hypothetical protein